MDFTQQTVVAWSRQDQALARRGATRLETNMSATVVSLNANGRQQMELSDGRFAFGPTNSNAEITNGSAVRFGSGLALTQVASAA